MSELGPSDGLLDADLTARLERFAADARSEEAARDRSRERWLRQAAAEEATLHGVLTDLAERRAHVTVLLRGGRSQHGALCAVGADFVAMRDATVGRGDVLVSLHAIVGVRTRAGEEFAAGDRPIHPSLRFAQVLERLAAERERVRIGPSDGGDALTGQLAAAGHDVVTVRPDGEAAGVVYVPIWSVGTVALAR